AASQRHPDAFAIVADTSDSSNWAYIYRTVELLRELDDPLCFNELHRYSEYGCGCCFCFGLGQRKQWIRLAALGQQPDSKEVQRTQPPPHLSSHSVPPSIQMGEISRAPAASSPSQSLSDDPSGSPSITPGWQPPSHGHRTERRRLLPMADGIHFAPNT